MKRLQNSTCLLLLLISTSAVKAQINEIPNGDFEEWTGGRPANYGAFQPPNNMFQTVFQVGNALSGKSALRIANANLMGQVIPGGVWFCEGGCQNMSRGKAGFKKSKFPVTRRYKTLCGYYKTNLKGGDKLWISIAMFKGSDPIGGSDSGEKQYAFITANTGTWKKFEIPITYFDKTNAVPDGAFLEIAIAGASFPKNPYAMQGTAGSEVWIDKLHFCEGKADLFVYNPKVLNEESTAGGATDSSDNSEPSGSGQNESTGTHEAVPKNELMNPGAQTFVNLDNDDMDEFFDHQPRDLPESDRDVAGGDDELIKIVLRIKNEVISETATATLSALKGRDNILVWNSETKGTMVPLPKTFTVLTDFKKGTGADEGFLVKEIWVEGITAHTAQQGTVLSFKFSEDPSFEEKFAITVIGIEKIEWIGRNNSIHGDNNLDRDPNHRNPSDNRPRTPGGDCNGSPGSFSLDPEGVRVFPDRRVVNGIVLDAKPRNTVDVKVTLTVKPVKPVKLYFKSFDVDDPTANGTSAPSAIDVGNEFWVDDEKKNSDNRGEVGTGANRKAGKITGEDAEGILEMEFDDITESFPFEVTMQPGDNFRIAGSCDRDFIKYLRNNDKELNNGDSDDERNQNKQRLVDYWVWKANQVRVEKAEMPLAQKYASKTLAVWRFLNVEIDYMTELTPDEIGGRIASVTPNQPVAGQTTILLRQNLSNELKKITTVSTFNGKNGIRDHFQDGIIKIELPGMTGNQITVEYPVLHNTANENGQDQVIVKGAVPEAAAGQTYYLRNDDLSQGFKAGDHLKNSIPGRVHATSAWGKCLVADRYAYAYIVPDFNSLNSPTLNQETSSPFIRNLDSYDLDDNVLHRNYRFDNAAFKDYEDFWTVYLLFAFKGATYEDGDPDGFDQDNRAIPGTANESMISGIADKQNVGIHVFLDGVIERNGRYSSANSGGLGELDCIAHELAHLFGAQHEDGGQMGVPGQSDKYPESRWFTQRSIARMREAKHP